ncbi:AsmA family protein [Azonexus sp. IMCC34842]|uniref:AsmA family protein n=1 Tax=Azonexus sp. IMCC34842 TaxID=3420950 RepID=UPI003D102E9B
MFPINVFTLLKYLAGIAMSVVLLALLLVAFMDWNLMRAPIGRWVSGATGRSFVINGDLSVNLGLPPRIVVNDLVLGNAVWSDKPNMLEIKRLDLRLDIFRLLTTGLAFPEIALSAPHVTLEVSRDGMANWVFNDQNANQEVSFPVIDRLTIDHGSVTYRDPRLNTDLLFELKTREGDRGNPALTLEIDGKGHFKGLPTTLHAQGGALLSLRSAETPYPIKANGVLGKTQASIEGILLDPLHFKGQQLNFTLVGNDLASLFPIIGVPIPPTPAYRLTGFLDHIDNVWTFSRFKGTIGQSDIAGNFAVDRNQQPQMISADLVSKQLRMQDLGGFIGADRGAQPSATPPANDRVLPAEEFSLKKLAAANADVHFRGEKIISKNTPLNNMTAHLVITDGKLALAPLDFGVAGGNLVSYIEMDSRQSPIVTHAEITAKGLHLAQLFPGSSLAAADTGTMGGRANLAGSGNSVARMLASANGEAALIMDGGSVGELTLRLANLDIANSLLVLLGGDKQVPIRCMVSNFKAVDGDFIVKDLLLDTAKVNIVGTGNIDFGDEAIHLRLVPESKGFSLASLRGPIAITGTFKTPVLRPELGGVIVRGGLAVALGAVSSGVGALIPLLDFGTERDSNCKTLLGEAKADSGVKTSDMAPRGGKAQNHQTKKKMP